MWQWIVCNSAGLQAVGAIVAALFAVAGFVVLCVYACDTRKIARAASNQTKDSLIPFIALDPTKNKTDPNAPLVWKMHNHGLGAAINIKIWLLDDNAAKQRFSMMSGGEHDILDFRDPDYPILIGRLRRTQGVKAEYESLAGEKFRSTFTMKDHSVDVTFENLSRK